MNPGDPDSVGVASALRVAEDRLRAAGMTGARAFGAVVDALRARLGEDVSPHPIAAEAIADAPVDGVDLLGLAYERFFADLFKGRRGQYFTPRPIAELLVGLARVGPRDDVLDPTCGSGGLLACASAAGAAVRGIEIDPQLASLAELHLRLVGGVGFIQCADFFSARPDPAHVVLANPPFSVVIDDPIALRRWGRSRKATSDDLFAEALGAWVLPEGRAAVILPTSVIANKGSEPIRARIREQFAIDAVIELPEGVFRPFGGAAGRACVLSLRKRPCREEATRWARVVDPGWDVRLTRYVPTGSREIDAILDGRALVDLPPGEWRPRADPPTSRSIPISRLASPYKGPVPTGPVTIIDLADTDRATGEVTAAHPADSDDLKGAKAIFEPGDVLFSRMRPELGTVALAHDPSGAARPMVGSSEWVVLRPERCGAFLTHALRTPAFRAGLPPTDGQTRPRVSPEAVAQASIPWPGSEVAEQFDRLAARIRTQRGELRAGLDRLQDALDRFAAGEIDADALSDVIEAVDSATSAR